MIPPVAEVRETYAAPCGTCGGTDIRTIRFATARSWQTKCFSAPCPAAAPIAATSAAALTGWNSLNPQPELEPA